MSHPKIVLEALRKLKEPSHITAISEACGLSYAQTANALSHLVGVEPPSVKRVEKGVYQLIGSDTPQLPVKQHQLSLPAALPEDFPDTSDSPEAAAAYFADRLKLWQLHKNISDASETLSPYNLPLPSILDPEEAMLFVDAIQSYIYGIIEYTELLNHIRKTE